MIFNENIIGRNDSIIIFLCFASYTQYYEENFLENWISQKREDAEGKAVIIWSMVKLERIVALY